MLLEPPGECGRVNGQPGSVLKMAGVPWRQIASPTASRQQSVVSLLDRRQDRAFLAYPSTTGPVEKYAK